MSFMTVGFDAISVSHTHVTSNCTATAVAAHLLAIVQNATGICQEVLGGDLLRKRCPDLLEVVS